jgi:hypothetical protein
MTEHDKRYLPPVDEILTDEQQREELQTWHIQNLWYQLPDSVRKGMDVRTEKNVLINLIINECYYQPK